VRLLVPDHLQAVFDRPQPVIGLAQTPRIAGPDARCCRQRVERCPRSPRAQRVVAPAMDQLVRLREELDLADPAATELEIVARFGTTRSALFVTNAMGQSANFVERSMLSWTMYVSFSAGLRT
jgi:hypothetical protein